MEPRNRGRPVHLNFDTLFDRFLVRQAHDITDEDIDIHVRFV